MKNYFLLGLFFVCPFLLCSQTDSDEVYCEEGEKMMNDGKFMEAISIVKSCLHEAKENENYERIVIVQFDLGNCYMLLENYDSAIINFNIVIETIQKQFNGNHQKLGLLYGNLGFCYSALGEIETAEKYGLKGLDFYKRKGAKRSVAKSLSSMCALYVNIGRDESAIEFGLEAIDLYQEILSVQKDTLGIAVNQYNVALAYSNLNKLIKSEKYIQNMLSTVKTNPAWERNYLPHGYLMLGQNHTNLEEYAEAVSYFRKIISGAEKYENANGLPIVLAHYHLGQALAQQNKYQEAIEHFDKAFSLAPEYLSGDGFLSARFYTGVSRSYTQIENFEKAIEYGNIALEKYEKIDLNGDYFHIQLIATMMQPNIELKRYKTADKLFEKAMKLLENSDYNSTRHYATLYLEKALNLAAQQKNDTARHYFELSLANICQGFSSLSEAGINCSPIAWLDDFKVVYYQTDFFTETSNEITDLERGIRQCSLAIIRVEKDFHSRIYRNKESLFSTLNSLAQSGQNAALKLYKLTQKIEVLETAFHFTDYQKSIELQKALHSSEALEYTNIPDSLLQKEKAIRRKLFMNETLLTEAIENRDSTQMIHYRDEVIFNLNKKYQVLLEEIAKHSAIKNIKSLFQSSLNHQDIQKSINEKELLIEYAINEEKKELILFTREYHQPLVFQKVALRGELFEQIQSFNKLLRKSTMNRHTSREKFIGLSHELYQQFIQPIEDQLVGKERLIIIGDGMTNYIPFEVLLKSNESKPFTELDYLMKNHEISYHYSATLFAKTRAKEQADYEGIYAFAPVYENGEGDALTLRKRENISMDTTLRAFDADGNYQPLPESEKEVNNILQQFQAQGIGNSTLALRAEATEHSLKINLEKPYQFIHIAGHSFADVENPKFSGIACFDAPEQAVEDGILYTGEIYNLATKADAVVLSSCESGFGKLEKSEGLLGLNRAFIYAGTPNVVFSLWKIYDTVSADLMRNFYEEVLKGQSYSAALREAKLKLLEDEGTASPHFWSPFLLIGR